MILELETILLGGVILLAGVIYYFVKKRSTTKKVSSKTNRQPIAPIKLVDVNNGEIPPVKTNKIDDNTFSGDKKGSIKKKKSVSVKKKKNKSGKVPDEELSAKRVLKDLQKLVLKIEEEKKDKYNEKYIQEQLDNKLRIMYESVQREYILEGNKSGQIDFDLGRGKVGIEVKLAKSIFVGSELDRLIGQIQKYREAKYDDENLIILIAGEEKYLKNSVEFSDLKRKIENGNAHYIYVKVKEEGKKSEL